LTFQLQSVPFGAKTSPGLNGCVVAVEASEEKLLDRESTVWLSWADKAVMLLPRYWR
jgi:hypothetical protein